MINYTHKPVLMTQVLQGLALRPGGTYVDCTFGRGGHTQAILAQLGEDGRVYAMDQDPEAIAYGQSHIKDSRLTLERYSFSHLTEMMESHGLMGAVDGILLDLGVSSPQLDDAKRGFSFQKDGPLDMRMDPRMDMDAQTWLATATDVEIASILKNYGEERYSLRIARAIVAARQENPITTTGQLVKIIEKAIPTRERNKHPATRSFQAIRIFINKELDALKQCLEQSLDVLTVGGRLVVISFHSLEDRIAKQFIQHYAKGDFYPRDLPIRQDKIKPKLAKVEQGLKASEDEKSINPRSRSAILRVAEKLI